MSGARTIKVWEAQDEIQEWGEEEDKLEQEQEEGNRQKRRRITRLAGTSGSEEHAH